MRAREQRCLRELQDALDARGVATDPDAAALPERALLGTNRLAQLEGTSGRSCSATRRARPPSTRASASTSSRSAAPSSASGSRARRARLPRAARRSATCASGTRRSRRRTRRRSRRRASRGRPGGVSTRSTAAPTTSRRSSARRTVGSSRSSRRRRRCSPTRRRAESARRRAAEGDGGARRASARPAVGARAARALEPGLDRAAGASFIDSSRRWPSTSATRPRQAEKNGRAQEGGGRQDVGAAGASAEAQHSAAERRGSRPRATPPPPPPPPSARARVPLPPPRAAADGRRREAFRARSRRGATRSSRSAELRRQPEGAGGGTAGPSLRRGVENDTSEHTRHATAGVTPTHVRGSRAAIHSRSGLSVSHCVADRDRA